MTLWRADFLAALHVYILIFLFSLSKLRQRCHAYYLSFFILIIYYSNIYTFISFIRLLVRSPIYIFNPSKVKRTLDKCDFCPRINAVRMITVQQYRYFFYVDGSVAQPGLNTIH